MYIFRIRNEGALMQRHVFFYFFNAKLTSSINYNKTNHRITVFTIIYLNYFDDNMAIISRSFFVNSNYICFSEQYSIILG